MSAVRAVRECPANMPLRWSLTVGWPDFYKHSAPTELNGLIASKQFSILKGSQNVRFPNYRFLTPCLGMQIRPGELPDSDATEIGFGIQDSVVRILEKSRRQKPVVPGKALNGKMEASESGSWCNPQA